MANIVIVTDQCYLLCEAINELTDEDGSSELANFLNKADKPEKKKNYTKKGSKKPTKKQLEAIRRQRFQIIIDFVPVSGSSANNGSIHKSIGHSNSATIGIKVSGRDHCLKLFSHMVEQIREQIPDNVFLDKIVENFIRSGAQE